VSLRLQPDLKPLVMGYPQHAEHLSSALQVQHEGSLKQDGGQQAKAWTVKELWLGVGAQRQQGWQQWGVTGADGKSPVRHVARHSAQAWSGSGPDLAAMLSAAAAAAEVASEHRKTSVPAVWMAAEFVSQAVGLTRGAVGLVPWAFGPLPQAVALATAVPAGTE